MMLECDQWCNQIARTGGGGIGKADSWAGLGAGCLLGAYFLISEDV